MGTNTLLSVKCSMIAFICLLQLNVNGQEVASAGGPLLFRKMDTSYKDVKPLISVLKDFEKKYNLNFSYEDRILEGKSVDMEMIGTFNEVEAGLKMILEPLGLNFEKLAETYYVIFNTKKERKKYKTLQEVQKRGDLSRETGLQNITAGRITVPELLPLEATISGKVTSEEGESLPGVNIMIKDTNVGTTTDIEGRYSITVPDDATALLFSYIGYETVEIAMSGKSVIDVVLNRDYLALDEVVVTALGIEREKQSLGYATRELQGDDLNQARETNFTSSLSGKVAGLEIRTNAGVGSSTRVILRGESSLNIYGNQPLFIVDGIPLSNDIINQSAADFGNGASEINPADIESVNVLKGPAAAALYGTRAANGAIVITTKSGKGSEGIGIQVQSGFTVEDILRLPKFQNEFGQGSNGVFEGSNFGYTGNLIAMPNGFSDGYDESWGPRLNYGSKRAQFDSPTTNGFRGGDVFVPNRGDIIPTPWISHPDNVSDFFEVGTTAYNNVAISKGNDLGSYRLSYTNLDQKGIVPNNDLQRNTLALNSSYHLTKKLRADLKLNYIRTTSNNRPDMGYGRDKIMYFFTWMGRNVDINSLRNYWQPGLEGIKQF
ncbi:MAG: TonB-dependent receptor plug domain-containing protein, partial [Cyclobacteriaceae bacterium]|nr:TonB-dependent receptor plug domain-containing protein [Cyclobacteriaceae bacterium]